MFLTRKDSHLRHICATQQRLAPKPGAHFRLALPCALLVVSTPSFCLCSEGDGSDVVPTCRPARLPAPASRSLSQRPPLCRPRTSRIRIVICPVFAGYFSIAKTFSKSSSTTYHNGVHISQAVQQPDRLRSEELGQYVYVYLRHFNLCGWLLVDS